MDEEAIRGVKKLINKTAKKHKIELERVIVFGSRAKENYRNKSDIDILIVSREFKDIAWNKRPGPFYEEWNYNKFPEPEFICLTPNEFKEKKKRKPHIVRTAVDEGISVVSKK